MPWLADISVCDTLWCQSRRFPAFLGLFKKIIIITRVVLSQNISDTFVARTADFSSFSLYFTHLSPEMCCSVRCGYNQFSPAWGQLRTRCCGRWNRPHQTRPKCFKTPGLMSPHINHINIERANFCWFSRVIYPYCVTVICRPKEC